MTMFSQLATFELVYIVFLFDIGWHSVALYFRAACCQRGLAMRKVYVSVRPAKNDFLRGVWEGVVRYWPPNELVFSLGILLCQFLWKSLKKCDRESAHRRTHTH